MTLIIIICHGALLAQSGYLGYSFTYTYLGHTLKYQILGTDSVQVSKSTTALTGNVAIPSIVDASGVTSLPMAARHSYTVTKISGYAFMDCTGMTGISIPSTVQSMNPRAFQGCTALTTITLPNALHNVSDYAFMNCTNLRYVRFPSSGSMVVGSKAFSGCTDLDSIYIGSAVTTIGNRAFENCTDFDKITIESLDFPSLGTNVFYNVPTTTLLRIPCGSGTTLGTSWSYFTNVVTYGGVNLSIASADNTMGHVDVFSNLLCVGQQVSLSAIPHTGYRFTHWSDGETVNPRIVTLQGDLSLWAYFSPEENDTVYLSVHDTTVIFVHDTSFIEVPFEIHDTIIMTEFVHIHDTIYSQIYDTTTIHDTLVQIEYVTIHDTAYYPVHDTTIVLQTDTITYIEYDTIEHLFYDTIILTDTLFLAWTDTIWMTDTIWEHDTIVVYDTIYLPHVSHPLLTAFPSVSGDATNSDASVSYTVGQVAAMQIECEAGSVNIGVQQSYVVEAVSVDGTDSLPFQVSVFPNPTTDNVSISIPYNSKVVSFYLFTVEGRLLQRGRLVPGERQLDLKDFPAGNYMLRLQFGKNVNMYRIIKIK